MRWTKGPGAWPAFWLLSYRHAVNPAYPSINPFCSQNSLPNPLCYSAELDVFEGQGTEPTVYYGTSHRNSCSCYGVNNTQNSNNYTNTNVDLTAGFHTYGMLWTSTGLSWYLDGQLLKSTPVYDSTNQPMFLLLQMWIGGWTWERAPRLPMSCVPKSTGCARGQSSRYASGLTRPQSVAYANWSGRAVTGAPSRISAHGRDGYLRHPLGRRVMVTPSGQTRARGRADRSRDIVAAGGTAGSIFDAAAAISRAPKLRWWQISQRRHNTGSRGKVARRVLRGAADRRLRDRALRAWPPSAHGR